MIDSSSLTWTSEEREVAVQVHNKIRTCALAGKPIPANVFEAQAGSKKNVSTEGVFINLDGEIYIVKRKSLLEKDTEPYPDMWHTPGVMHAANEDLDQTYARLVKSELGDDITIIERRGPIAIEAEAPPRAKFTMLIMPTLISGMPSKAGKFVQVTDIPWDQLIPCHRDQILPTALKDARRAGWIV